MTAARTARVVTLNTTVNTVIAELAAFTITPHQWAACDITNPARTDALLRIVLDDTDIHLYFFDKATGPVCASAKFNNIGARPLVAMIADYLINGVR